MKKGTYEDQIRIEELEVYAHHGVYPEENEKGQHFNGNTYFKKCCVKISGC